MRSMSETSAQGISGPGGGPGPGGAQLAAPSGGGSNPGLPSYTNFPTSGSQILGNLQNGAEAGAAGLAAGAAAGLARYAAEYGITATLAALTAGEAVIPVVGWAAAIGTGLFEIFDEIFGGGGSPSYPPNYFLFLKMLTYKTHIVYGKMNGILVLVSQGSDAPEFRAAPSGSVSFPLCAGLFLSETLPTAVACPIFASGCPALAPCALAAGTCLPELAGLVGCYEQAHGKPFGNPGEKLPPGEPEEPSAPLQQPGEAPY